MPTFLFVANNPSLDLVNTEVIFAGVRTDLLNTFRDLTQWCEQTNLLSAAGMQKLAKIWVDTPEAEATLQAARTLRGVLRNAVERVAKTGRVPGTLADALGNGLREPRLAIEVVPSHGRLKTKPHWILETPADILAPVVNSAATFFATADYSAIRRCENPKCIFWFYDTSKNHSRRWCSMDLCGNRAKVAAFRERI